MIKVLITGRHSFIGNATENWFLEKKGYTVEKISLRDGSWKNHDFSRYDVIVHVAGIAHASEKNSDEALYDKINHQLTYEVAFKAKQDGVKHFIFLSSMIVYNPSQSLIISSTIPNPKGPYAKSKLNAENALKTLSEDAFKVTILRPAMVYGPNSKGNFPRLVKLASRIPIFPRIQNKRSMLYINHLTEAIYQLIQTPIDGVFHLADEHAISTFELVVLIRETLSKKTILTRLFNPLIKLGIPLSITLRKLFHDYQYESALIKHPFKYHLTSLESAIKDVLRVSHE